MQRALKGKIVLKEHDVAHSDMYVIKLQSFIKISISPSRSVV